MAIDQQILGWLVNTSAGDQNFKNTLERDANEETIIAALEQIKGKDGHKGREKALQAQLNKLSKQAVDEATEAAEQVVDVEALQESATTNDQATREKLIAQCHEVIGRVQANQLMAKFGNVASLVYLKSVKESKIYRDLPGIGTWDKFCEYIGLSRRKVDEDLLNLTAFGEEFLETCCQLQVGYRDLKKLRQLTHDGSVHIEDQTVIIGDEAIPLDADHRDDLQAAIEKLLDEKNAELTEAKATVRAKDRIIESKEQVINRQESEIARHEARAKSQGFAPGEEAFFKQLDADRTVIDGILLKYQIDPADLRDDITPRMTAALIEQLGYLRKVLTVTHQSMKDLFESPDNGDWDPDAALEEAGLSKIYELK